MAKPPVEVVTQLSMAEAVEIFRKAMRVSWVSENITGAGTTFEQPAGDVFDQLNIDPPDFGVMAVLGGRGADIQRSAVHMYAWDRGDRREIQMSVGKNLAALGVKAKQKIRRFVAGLEERDSTVKCVGV